MRQPVLFVFLLVAVLAVLGYLTFRDVESVAPAGIAGSHASAATGPGAAATAVSADVGKAGGAPGSVDGAADTALRSAAPVVLSDDAAAPGYRISGRIVDRQDAPRAGVEIQAAYHRSFAGGFAVADLPAPTGSGRAQRVSARTAPDGRFELVVPDGMDGRLDVVDDELVFRDRPPQFQASAGDRELGDLAVIRAARLQGVVQDERGQPIAGVRVQAQLGPLGFGAESSVETGADGRFSLGKLRPGSWTLRTESSRFLPAKEEFELAPEQQLTDLVVELAPGKAIAGRVIDDRGVGVAGMRVGSRRQEVIGGMDLQRFSANEATTTAADGSFSLAGLEGDQVMVRAFGPGHTSAQASKVPVGTGNLELRVQRYGVVEGVLVSPDGSPIVGSRVSAVTANAAGEGAIGRDDGLLDMPMLDGRSRAQTDENGHFVLDEVRPGSVTISAEGKTHRPVSQTGLTVLPARRVEGLRLVAATGATARVQVVDGDGKPVADAKVRVQRGPLAPAGGAGVTVRSIAVGNGPGDVVMGPGAGELGAAESDEHGIAVIMGLPAGDVVLEATHADFAPALAVPVALPVSGTVEGKVVLRAPGHVDVRVTRSDGSAAAASHVVLEAEEGGEHEGVTDAEGTAHFGPLAAGGYTAVLSLGPRERTIGNMSMVIAGEQEMLRSTAMPVMVTAGRTAVVDLRYPVLTTLTGRVLGTDGPEIGCVVELESAGERAGMPGLGGRSATTDDGGRFVFEDVESGDYVLRYGKASQIVKASEDVAVPPNTPELHRELELRTGSVRVRLQAADDGEPVDRGEVTLHRGGGGSGAAPQRVMMFAVATVGDSGGDTSTMTFGTGRTLSDGGGVAVIEDVPVGTYTLRVEHRNYAPASKDDVVVVERQVTDCGLIEMSAAGQIRGKVLDAAGNPVAMAMIERRAAGTEEWTDRETAMRGSYRMTGLAPGRYELRARSLDASGGGPSAAIEVEVRAGKTEVADLTVK